MRTPSLGDPFERLLRGSVEADFDAMRRECRKTIGVSLCHEGPVGKDGDEKAVADGMFVDVEKICPGHRFSAGEAEFECAGLGQLVHNAEDFRRGEFLANELRAIETVRIAHDASQVAAAGDFPLAGDGKPLRQVVKFICSDHGRRQPLQSRESRAGLPAGFRNLGSIVPRSRHILRRIPMQSRG